MLGTIRLQPSTECAVAYRIFISYAHKDAALKEELEQDFPRPLEREALVAYFGPS